MQQRARLVSYEELAVTLAGRPAAETEEAAMDEAYTRAYTGAGTRGTRGVRLVLVPELDSPDSAAAVGGASVSPFVASR
jgi:hypothetical protein